MPFAAVARLIGISARRVTAIEEIAAQLQGHGCAPEQIESLSIDMSPVYIKGCGQYLPNARITFDKFQVVQHTNAVDKMRRVEQGSDKSPMGLR